MKITLVTICLRGAASIRTAIESVLAQKNVDCEYLVIDGGSDDGTVDILKEYEAKFKTGSQASSRLSFRWLSEKDRGMYDALNKGIRMATGDIIGLLHSDDVLAADDILARVASAFEADDSLDGTYGDIRFVKDSPFLARNDDCSPLSRLRQMTPVRYCCGRWFKPWMFRFGTQTAHPSTFFRKSCFTRWGDYSLNYVVYGDYELLLRFIWLKQAKMRYIPLCTTIMRIGGASTNGWRATLKINRTIYSVLKDYGIYTNYLFLYARYLLKIWGYIFKSSSDPVTNVLLLSLICSPDNVSTAQIMAGIARDLHGRDFRVRVLTTTPHYHRDVSMEVKQPLTWKLWPILKKSEMGGVEVTHIVMPPKSCPKPLRLLSWFWFVGWAFVVGLFMRFRIDGILVCTPPPLIGPCAVLLSKFRRARLVYNVQELYPDIAVNLNVMRAGGLVWKVFSWMERITYRQATYVTSITEAMCAKLRARLDPAKVKLVPNFVEFVGEGAAAKGPARPFTVTYAGNMGVPQKLDLLVEVARELPEITVWFVGDGGDRARLESLAQGLSNVVFTDYQPISKMPRIYMESDLFYVGQDPAARSDGIPSKIYRILGNGKPILAATADSSDLAGFVRTSGGGVVVCDFNPKTMAQVVRELNADRERCDAMAAVGRRYVIENFSWAHVSSLYADLLRR